MIGTRFGFEDSGLGPEVDESHIITNLGLLDIIVDDERTMGSNPRCSARCCVSPEYHSGRFARHPDTYGFGTVMGVVYQLTTARILVRIVNSVVVRRTAAHVGVGRSIGLQRFPSQGTNC